MRSIPATKMSGTGNDFVLVDNRDNLIPDSEKSDFVVSVCPRRTSVGADGVIFVEASIRPGHDYRMRYFNADGGEADMCGNGSRCIALFAHRIGAAGLNQTIQTAAGTIYAHIDPENRSAKIQLPPPTRLRKIKVDLSGQSSVLYHINTGVPHAILFVPKVDEVDIRDLGAKIRYHPTLGTNGSNANFVELLGANEIRIRTYERGVEDETLACGTGATACAIATGLIHGYASPLRVHIASGESLYIHFKLKSEEQTSEPPHLEGKVRFVFKGEVYWDTEGPGHDQRGIAQLHERPAKAS